MSPSKQNGMARQLFQKVENPMSLLHILESRLPHSCCLVNQLLAFDDYKDDFVAYAFEEPSEGKANGKEGNDHSQEVNGAHSNLWILFNYHREDWNCCITISSPTPTSDDISPQAKYALEFSEILDWGEPFVFLNVDLNVSDFLIKLNTRKLGNVIKIFPCNIFHMYPSDAAKTQVPPLSDPSVTVAPLDLAQGVEFLTKNWDYTGPGTREFLLKSMPKHVSAGVYLPNGEIVCGAIATAYGQICLLVTRKDHRRKGYASLVMRYIFRELGKRGFHPAWESRITNHSGNAFHSSLNPKIIAKVDYICHKCM